MKKGLLVLMTLAMAFSVSMWAEAEKPTAALISPNFIGPLFGFYSGTVEFAMNEQLSFEIEPGYFNIKTIPLVGANLPQDFEFWFGSAKAGLNYYVDGSFKGLYAGAYAKAAYFAVGNSSGKFNSGAAGIGAKGGYRFTWDWFSMALGGGYEFNKAFAAIDSNTVDVTTKTFLSQVEGAFPYAFFTMAIAVK